jgi:alpha-beta hydrolase superfamily lysophospholipase
MELLSRILAGMYLALPPAAVAVAVYRWRRTRSAHPLVGFLLTCVSGTILGGFIALLYARATDTRAPLGQIGLTVYLAVGVLSMLKGISWLLKQGIDRLLRVHRREGEPPPLPGRWRPWREASAVMLRAFILFAFGLPYIMAVVMVYRPKVTGIEDPTRQLGFPFEPVQFTTSDGLRLDGWWVPARFLGPGSAPKDPLWGKRTIILCHGLGANKGNQFVLARELVPGGFNVLAFDFRAHGESGGHTTSFGDLERRDVLAAVKWLRGHRPDVTEKIFGLGVSMGGAALIGAAADDSPEGRAIDAVAVVSTYDDLGSLADSVADRFLVPPFDFVGTRLALPIASAHAGSNLSGFRPAVKADGIAPRPLLVVHGRGDDTIQFEHGQRLFEAASQPKLRLWVGKLDKSGKFLDGNGAVADHNGIILSEDVSKSVRLFFEGGQQVL